MDAMIVDENQLGAPEFMLDSCCDGPMDGALED